ncbi:MAG: PqqD family protein [Renibacterium salmoninarum]|nr:PqqD family protein [Renibacterium salmoninarum]
MKSSAIVSRCPETLTAEIDDEAVLVLDLDSEAGTPLRLEGTASVIWQEIVEPLRFGVLCHRMAERYQSTETEIRPDVETFVRELAAANLARIDELAE